MLTTIRDVAVIVAFSVVFMPLIIISMAIAGVRWTGVAI